MSSDSAIVIRGLGKSYAISAPGDRRGTFREAIVHRARHPLHRRTLDTFWALRDVNLEVAPGEVVGVIGGNGAGKSTLLKILSRITEPTEGRAELRGRVGSLLEVGTGFHPELTGRENVYLNGAILGMRRAEIDRHFEDIVEFAGIGVFLDTPVKRYSSGMYVRLAFAVAAHLQPEILIIDEVLAVGDAEFQRRCLGKMESAASEEGRTILFVSHNLAAVESLCSRAIYLQRGQVVVDGAVDAAIQRYLTLSGDEAGVGQADLSKRDNPHQPDGRPIVERVEMVGPHGRPTTTATPIGGDIHIRLQTRGLNEFPSPVVGIKILNAASAVMLSATTRMVPPQTSTVRSEEEDVTVTLHGVMLAPGDYWVDFGVKDRRDGGVKVDYAERVVRFTVAPTDLFGSGYQPSSSDGQMYAHQTWSITSRDEGCRE